MKNIFKSKNNEPLEMEVQNYLIKRFVYFITFLIFTIVISFVLKILSLSLAFLILSLVLCAWWLISYRNFRNNKYIIIEGKFKEINTTQDDDKKNRINRALFSGYGKTEITIISYSDYFNDKGEVEELNIIAPVKYGFEAGENSTIRIYFSEGSIYKKNNNTYYINSPLIVHNAEN